MESAIPARMVMVFSQKSALGTVYCKKASVPAHTILVRPPTTLPKTARRRYSYTWLCPSTERKVKSRAGKASARCPKAVASAANRTASASPAQITSAGRPVSSHRAASTCARAVGGRPNRPQRRHRPCHSGQKALIFSCLPQRLCQHGGASFPGFNAKCSMRQSQPSPQCQTGR